MKKLLALFCFFILTMASAQKISLQKALEIYNDEIKTALGATGFDLNILTNANGYGLQITF
ncbi:MULTISPECIES: hypothetical protein [Flavobacterium]|uniref:hypothetical protein n=1 Tax=Flavobacterium TaxID=237 RepID=UPI001FCB7787|nr:MULTISPECIES: hypothetical protein [Flavobacterium]UOK41946.1 hypothetical protein LZF87_11595 [Flavobacterium enshiense]